MKWTFVPGLLMMLIATSASAVAEPESVSLQDMKPECRERHPSIPAEECMIQDRVIVRQYIRRFTEPVLIVPPSPPVAAQREGVAPSGAPAIIQVLPATP